MGLKERTAAWKKALTMIEAVKGDQKKLGEMEGIVSRITSDLEESINRGEFPDLRSLYEQQSLAIKLQSTLEDLREGTEELERLEKRLRSFCKGMHAELKMHAQIREQARKGLRSLREVG
jgi:hypothetical protein